MYKYSKRYLSMKKAYIFWSILYFLSLLNVRNAFSQQSSFFSKHGLFWSGASSNPAIVSRNGIWEQINGGSLNITLYSAKLILISYEVVVEGLKDINSSLLPQDGVMDTLQVRCLVDGYPYRYSSAMATNYDMDSRIFSRISAIFAVNLTANNHQIIMQWKKSGSKIGKWLIDPSGGGGKLSLIAQADYSMIAFMHESQDAFLYQSDGWKSLSRNLTFSLLRDSSVTISYSIVVQPQLSTFIKDRTMEYLSTRAIVDGIFYTDGVETFGSNAWNPVASCIRGQLRLNLRAGRHTVYLQWRKHGNAFKGWASNPSSMDGFASSRNIIVSVDKMSSQVILDHSRDILPASGSWSVVGNKSIQLNLIKQSAVLFSYGLPITQHGNPNFDSNLWEPLSRVDTRLVVDGIGYTFAGASIEVSSRRIDSAFGQLALILPEGMHTVELQWKSDQVSWTILNDLSDGFLHGERLLTFISSENAKPSIAGPSLLTSTEDTPLAIFDISINDIDSQLEPGMEVFVNISVAIGTITFPNLPVLANGVQFYHSSSLSIASFYDTIQVINYALAGMVYHPKSLFYGEDVLNISISDNANLGYGSEQSFWREFRIIIESVDNPFTLKIPSRVDITIGSYSTLIPIILEDPDSDQSIFSAKISAICGSLTVQSNANLLLSHGHFNQSKYIAFSSKYDAIKEALLKIQYIPNAACNSRVHPDIITITVENTENMEHTLVRNLAINYVRAAVPPVIRGLTYPRWKIDGVNAKAQSSDSSSQEYTQNYLNLGFDDELRATYPAQSSAASEMVLYQSSEMAYALSVAFSNFSSSILGSSYVVLGTPWVLKLSLETSSKFTSIYCDFNGTRFPASFTADSAVDCKVTELISSDVDKIVWVKLVGFNGETRVESNYMALYPMPPFIIESVLPSKVFANSQSIVSIVLSGPSIVSRCIFDGISTAAYQDNFEVKCRVPKFNSSYSSSTSLMLGYGDNLYSSNTWELEILPDPLIIDSTFERDQASGIVTAKFHGNWTGDSLNSVQFIKCSFSSFYVDYDYRDEHSVYCTFPLSENVIRNCCASQSCEGTIIFDNLLLNPSKFQCSPNLFPVLEASKTDLNSLVPQQLESSNFIYIKGNFASDLTSAVCLFGETKVVPLLMDTDTLKCEVPQAVDNNTFHLIDMSGKVWASSTFSQLPVISSISPLVGRVFGGADVMIKTNKADLPIGDYSCHFEKIIVEAFVVNNNSVYCLSPAHSPGLSRLRISINNILLPEVSPVYFDYKTFPVIQSLQPKYGSLNGGDIVSVVGHGFHTIDSDIFCLFGDAVSAANISSDALVHCQVPHYWKTGAVAFSLVSSEEIFCEGSCKFTYVDNPVLTSIQPSFGPISGGTKLIIQGTNFDSAIAMFCAFDDVLVPATVLNSFTLSCLSPSQDTSKEVSVGVSVGGGSIIYQFKYRYVKKWVVESFYPKVAFSGQIVKFYFNSSSSLSEGDRIYCSLNDNEGLVVPIDARTISCEVYVALAFPPLFAISVNNIFAEVNSSLLTIIPPPEVRSMTPIIGNPDGGEVVTITGQSFSNVADVSIDSFCTFGSLKSKAMRIVNDTSIMCLTPAFDGSDRVSVGVSFSSDLQLDTPFEFSYITKPIISGIYPTVASTAGGSLIEIFGNSFSLSKPKICDFGFTMVPSVYISQTKLACLTPSLSEVGAVTLQLTVRFDSADTNGAIFDIDLVNPPQFESIYPSDGPTIGFTEVLVYGSDFRLDYSYSCVFNTTITIGAWVNNNTLSCITPSLPEGLALFTIMTSGIVSSSPAVPYLYRKSLMLSRIYPQFGPISGNSLITVEGKGFEVDDLVFFCRFGSVDVLAVVLSDSTLTCQSPQIDSAAVVKLSIVSNNVRYSSGQLDFNYFDDIQVLNVFPTKADGAGGREIFIELSGFPSYDMSCIFGDKLVHGQWKEGSTFVCISPSLLTGDYSIDISFGQYKVRALESLEIPEPIQILSVSPSVAKVGTSDLISVVGTSFDTESVILCLFGSDIKTSGIYVNDTLVQCSSPAQVVTNVVVGLEVDGYEYFGSSEQTFSSLVGASIFSVEPNILPIDSKITAQLTGKGFASIEQFDVYCVYGLQIVPLKIISDELAECQLVSDDYTFDDGSLILKSVDGVVVSNAVLIETVGKIGVNSIYPSRISTINKNRILMMGTNFFAADKLKCYFGDTHSKALYINGSVIECSVPIGIQAGEYDYGLLYYGEYISGHGIFEIVKPGKIIDIFPKTGHSRGAYSILVTGDFNITSGYVSCYFNESTISYGWIASNSELHCMVPSLEVGIAQVSVTVNGINMETDDSIELQIAEEPIVSNAYPSIGDISGDYPVTFTGENFILGFNYSCLFGDIIVPASAESSTKVICSAPSVDFAHHSQLKLAYGLQYVSSNSFLFKYIEKVSVFGTDISTLVAGGSIFVYGANFPQTSQATCLFNELEGKGTVINSTIIRCNSPKDLIPNSLYQVHLKFEGWLVSTNNNLFVKSLTSVAVTRIEPEVALSNKPTLIKVLGSGFSQFSKYTCLFEDMRVAAKVLNESEIQCMTPYRQKGETLFGIEYGGIVMRNISKILFESGAQFTQMTPRVIVNDGSTTDLRFAGEAFFELTNAFCIINDMKLVLNVESDVSAVCTLSSKIYSQDERHVYISIISDDVTLWKTSVDVALESSKFIRLYPSLLERKASLIVNIAGSFYLNGRYSCDLNYKPASVVVVVSEILMQCIFTRTNSTGLGSVSLRADDENVSADFPIYIIDAPSVGNVSYVSGISNSMLVDVLVLGVITDSSLSFGSWSCTIDDFTFDGVVQSQSSVRCTIPSHLLCSGVSIYLLEKESQIRSKEIFVDAKQLPCIERVVGSSLEPQLLRANETNTARLSSLLAKRNFADNSMSLNSFLLEDDQSSDGLNIYHSPAAYSLLTGTFSPAFNSCFINNRSCMDFVAANDFISSLPDTSYNRSTWYYSFNETLRSQKFIALDSVSPKSINAANGSWVQVIGRNFDSDTVCYLSNNTRAISTIFISNSELTCFVPSWERGDSEWLQLTVAKQRKQISSQIVELWYDSLFNSLFNPWSKSEETVSMATVEESILSGVIEPSSGGSVCLSKFGCSVLSVTNQLLPFLSDSSLYRRSLTNFTLRDRFEPSEIFNSSAIAATTATDVSIFRMSPLVVQVPCDDCYLSFIGNKITNYGPWYLKTLNYSTECYFFSDNEIMCPVHSQMPPGKFEVELKLRSSSFVYRQFVSFLLESELRRSLKLDDWKLHDSSLLSAKSISAIQLVQPSMGPTTGGTRLTFSGKHLEHIVACVFHMQSTGSDAYVAAEFDRDSSEYIFCVSPPSNAVTRASISLVTKSSRSIPIQQSFDYVLYPNVYSSFISVYSNTTVIVLGSGLDYFQQAICSLYYSDPSGYNASIVLVGNVFSDNELHCINLPHSIPLFNATISISFNGIDFSDAVAVTSADSLTSAVNFIKPLSSSLPTSEKFVYPDVSAAIVHLTCSSGNLLPFSLGRGMLDKNISCKLDGQHLGSSVFQNNGTAVCRIPSLRPGTYRAQIVSNNVSNDWMLETSLICEPDPVIDSSTLVKAFDPIYTKVSIHGYNFQSEVRMSCSLNNVLSNMKQVSNTEGMCVFQNLVPVKGVSNFTVYEGARERFRRSFCLDSIIFETGGLLSSDSNCSMTKEPEMKDDIALVKPFSFHIQSMSPRSGLAAGKTVVRFQVEGVDEGDNIQCKFGNQSVAAFVTSKNLVICRAPAAPAGNVSVDLFLNDGSAKWCCDWFYYYPVVSIVSFDPARIMGEGGSLLALSAINLPGELGLDLHCFLNNIDRIPAFKLNSSSVVCELPPVYTPVLNISIGSYHESWSNIVSIAVQRLDSPIKLFPKTGKVSGGTEVDITLVSHVDFIDPWCQFGSSEFTPGVWDKENLVIKCITPASPVASVVDVSVRDGSHIGDPVYYAGMFTFQASPELFSVSLSSIERGKNVLIRAFGNNYIDSAGICCLVDKETVPARWMSINSVLCDVPAALLQGKRLISLQLSNNYGRDSTASIQIKTHSNNELMAAEPRRGFSTGGSNIEIFFKENVDINLFCLFKSLKRPAFITSPKSIICKTPVLLPGPLTVFVTDQTSEVLGQFTFESVELPVLLTAASNAVLRNLSSSVDFLGDMLDSSLVGRLVSPDGSFIPASCKTASPTVFRCENIACPSEYRFNYATLEISSNLVDFASNIATVQVFTPTRLLWVDPLYVIAEGNDKIRFGVDRTESMLQLDCVFESRQSGLVYVPIDITGQSTTVTCSVPSLDAEDVTLFSIRQFGNILFGPRLMNVEEAGVVRDMNPTTLLSGLSQTVTIRFVSPLSTNLIPSLLFQGIVTPMTMINPFNAITIVQPTGSGPSMASIIYDNHDSFVAEAGVLHVADFAGDISFEPVPVVRNKVSNVTFVSQSCQISSTMHCITSSGEVAAFRASDNCSLSCLIRVNDLLTNSTLLSLCYDTLCRQPLASTQIDIVSTMTIILTVPSMGATLGGNLIRVYGSGFVNDGTLMCAFGSNEAKAIVESQHIIQCILPPSEPGKVSVNIKRKGVVVSVSSAEFEYIPILSNVIVTPSNISSLGGTTLTLTVADSLDSYRVQYCRFNEIFMSAIVLNGTTIVCQSPPLPQKSEVDFAIASDLNGDFSVAQKLAVVQPSYPTMVDPEIFEAGKDINVTISFDNVNFAVNPTLACLVDDQSVPSVAVEAAIICMVSGLIGGSHKIALMANSVKYFEYEVRATSGQRIQSIWPSFVFLEQSSAITLTLAGDASSDEYFSCCFGPHRTPALSVSSNQWQCYTPKLNYAGLDDILVLPVGMAASEGFCEFSLFDISFVPPIEITNPGSLSGMIYGGDSITVKLKIPLPVESIYCRMGAFVSLGLILDDEVVCMTPSAPPGLLGLDISVNGVDFYQTGITYSFMQPEPSGEIYDLSVQDTFGLAGPVIYFTSESTFTTSLQQTVVVTGRNFFVDSICILESGLVLESSFVDSNHIKCTIPIHMPGQDNIYVRNGNSKVSQSLEISFVATPAIADFNSIVVDPAIGPRQRETVISITMLNLLESDSQYYCLIGDDWVLGFFSSDKTLSCIAPKNNFVGKVKVRVGRADLSLLEGQGFFEYLDDPIAFNVEPKVASANDSLIITGLGFTRFPNISIWLGGSLVSCYVVSDSKLQCIVPDLPEDDYSIILALNGQHVVHTGLSYSQRALIQLTSLWPFNGPALKAGTLLSVYGSNFPMTIDVSCLIDASIIPATVLSPSLVQCRVPSHRPGLVSVSLLADGVALHPRNSSLSFLYLPDVSVVQIFPNFGYTSGEFPIIVFGTNFVNSSSLGCKFADMKSRGIFLSNTSIICLSPSSLGRPQLASLSNVPVEVTLNGYDYSDSRILFQYSQPCDKGFFCPGMSRQLCPNGTYCPENSRNFTLCQPGTFQPQQGQVGCAPCPVGYICPDQGMPRPVHCPPGLICDSMGLRASNKLCPAGSYCLNTTKASNIDQFDGLLGWIKNNITGVVSFNSSVFNYSYSSWPLPALGKSRPQAPPELWCDGLVCSGGSTEVLAEAPFPCPIGHYCRSGAGTEIPVPKNFSTPQRCFDGYFCPRGSLSPEGYGACPNGYFCPTQLNAIICPRGHYCPGVGNRDPVECYPGTYNPFEGKANCTVCPTGHICPGWGLLLPERCPAGFVCLSLGLSFPVVLCPAGYRCDEGTLTLDPSDTTPFKPKVCKKGQFCLGGVSSTIDIDWIQSQPYGVTHPQKCSEGTYCKAGAYLSSGSGLCFEGHYCPPNSSFPTQTPLGNFASARGSVAPTLCYPGSYSPLNSQITCDICPSGHSCISYGTYIPTICDPGTYRSQIDSLTCTPCPTGTYSYETGSPDISLCLPCPSGRVCGSAQMTTLGTSTQCPAGYMCGYGTDRSNQFLYKCPAGYSTTYEAYPEDQYSTPCSAGYYCARGTPTYQNTAGKCPVGSFCPRSTPVAPARDILCPYLTTSLSGLGALQGCRVDDVDVCDKSLVDPTDPSDDVTYYSKYSYLLLDDSGKTLSFDSSLTSTSPTGEIQVPAKIHPLNASASSPTWVNDTIEAFRACPLYGSGQGGDVITIIGRNFADTHLNFCKFRFCYSANLGLHPRRCKNQIKAPTGEDLPVVGNISDAFFISKAKYISSTRMECTTPQFLFQATENFNPTFAANRYQCMYVNGDGQVVEEGYGNFSFVRPCDTAAGTVCINKPYPAYEYFNSLTFPCTSTEIVVQGICSNTPEPGFMFNPCMSGEVAVEVTNDGEHYTGGIELRGNTIQSTVRYGDGGVIYRNFKNSTVNATLAVYTFVMPQFFYENPGILEMEKSYCSLPRLSEEGPRKREEGWYLLKLNEIGMISVDLTFLSSNFVYGEHYQIAIYIRPSRCDSNFCTPARVRLPPTEYLPCQSPVDMSYWFAQTYVPKNVVNNITVYALEDLLFKVEIHLLHGLYSSYAPLFGNTTTVIVKGPSRSKVITGLDSPEIMTRNLTQYVSFTEAKIPMQYFFCAVVYQDDSLYVSQPLNLPPLYESYKKGRALIMNNVSEGNSLIPLVLDPYANTNRGVQFWMMPATTPDESKELLDAYFEYFQDTVYDPVSGYQFQFATLVLPYFPYFSNCYTFDSYIPIWYALEGDECKLPDFYAKSWTRYNYPALPSFNVQKFVGPFDFFSQPIGDYCYQTLTCNYEEVLSTTDSTPRWFELLSGADLFHFIRVPIDYYQFTGRSTHISKNDAGGGAYVALLESITSDNFIPVVINHSYGSSIPGCIYQCFARSYSLMITYYMEDMYNKRIITATLIGNNYDFNQENKEYSLTMWYYPLGFLELILYFAFPLSIFIIIFIFVGILTWVIAGAGWIMTRIFTLLQNPPQLRMTGMLVLIVPPPLAGTFLAVILIWLMTTLGNYFINGVFIDLPSKPTFTPYGTQMLDSYPLSYNALGTIISTSEMQIARYGRIGSVFFIVGFFCFFAASRMYFPREESKREHDIAEKRTPLAKKEDLWKPVMWKKLNFIFCSFVLAVVLMLVVSISFWTDFGTFFFQVVVMLTIFGELLPIVAMIQLGDMILVAVLSGAWTFVQGFIAFGAPNFLYFLLTNFLDFAVTTFQRIYQDFYMNTIGGVFKAIFNGIVALGKMLLPKYLRKGANAEEEAKKSKEYKKRAVEGVVEEAEESESVEPILEYFSDVSCDTMIVYYFPFIVYLLMQYRNQIYIPLAYGIRNSDMMIYMVYQIILIIFQPVIDVFNHSQCELFWGWKVYEYLVYSRYRFLQRETRWKGMENTLDECIEVKLRRLDQMCFSSQYFLMLCIQMNGIIYIILAFQVWLTYNYSPFSDSGFFLLFGYMFAMYILLRYGIMYLAVKLKVWKIKHENTAWHIQAVEEDELDIPAWEEIKGASAEAFLMNQRITSETFRYKFLNYNRTWLINQLPELLTPRTLRRSRPYLINQFQRIINARRDDISDESEDDKVKKFGAVALSNPSRNIIRYWLGKARRRLRLRSIVEPVIKRARGAQCEQCLSRKQLQIEYEVDVDAMAAMYDKTYPGDEEVDQVQWKGFWIKNQRYHTICLACLTKRKEVEARNAMAAMKGGLDPSLFDDDEQEAYPEWGPVFLSAPSKAMLLNWYHKAQKLRAGKRKARNRKEKVVKDISDDEGEDPMFSWLKEGLKEITPASKAIAVKWMRTARARLQQKRGKGTSVRESDLAALENEGAAGETFKSGRKSKMLRK